MVAFLTSILGVATIGAYLYVAVMFGLASNKAGNDPGRVLIDAATWPVMGWKAIYNLYHHDSST